MPRPAQPSPFDKPSQEEDYQPVDALTPTIKCVGVLGGFGAFVAAAQSTLTRHNIGALGPFTQYGGTIISFAGAGAAYEFSRHATANLRQKHDVYNEAVGGFLGGAVLGLRMRSMTAVLGFGSALSVIMSAFDVSGGTLFGRGLYSNVDEYERKEALRGDKRRPVQETIDELGEGRGVYGPGYAERRRQRMKERYRIDVPNPTPS